MQYLTQSEIEEVNGGVGLPGAGFGAASGAVGGPVGSAVIKYDLSKISFYGGAAQGLVSE